MGWLYDLLKEVPLSAVLKERIGAAEQKYSEAVEENRQLKQRVDELEQDLAELQRQIPVTSESDISDKTREVLVYLFESEHDDRDVGALAHNLQMQRSVAQYHLEQLEQRGLATVASLNMIGGRVYWGLTSEGRRYVVENGLAS